MIAVVGGGFSSLFFSFFHFFFLFKWGKFRGNIHTRHAPRTVTHFGIVHKQRVI